jgi:hypothetical protein
MSTQSPTVHSVHVYDQDLDLINRLCSIVSTSLRIGDAVLIVSTQEHRDQLVQELEGAGIDIRASVRQGRYTMLDAQEALSTFMRNGKPDCELFAENICKPIADAHVRARSLGRGVTVFGEMVSVLWEQGNKGAALELEGLWNAALSDGSFHLHCAYPRNVFADDGEFRSVCETHSHVLQ